MWVGADPQPHGLCASRIIDENAPVLQVCALFRRGFFDISFKLEIMSANTNIVFDGLAETSENPEYEEPVVSLHRQPTVSFVQSS
jgi:hypothetical protein